MIALLQIRKLQELVEEVRRCTCSGSKCMKCRSALDRMDSVLDRAYSDTVHKAVNGKGKRS